MNNAREATQKEKLKQVRLYAKKNGQTFRAKNATFNGAQLYQLVDRDSGIVEIDNVLLNSFFNKVILIWE